MRSDEGMRKLLHEHQACLRAEVESGDRYNAKLLALK